MHHKIMVEFWDEPSRRSIICSVARIPVVGDIVCLNDECWRVKYVLLTLNPSLTARYEAYIRVGE